MNRATRSPAADAAPTGGGKSQPNRNPNPCDGLRSSATLVQEKLDSEKLFATRCDPSQRPPWVRIPLGATNEGLIYCKASFVAALAPVAKRLQSQ